MFEQTPQTSENPAPRLEEDESSFQSFGVFIWDLAKILILSLAIIIPIRYFLFQPFVVSGSSMEPNFFDGDYLIIDELTYRFYDPQRGDVVVLRFPDDPSQFFIKRVIGLPNERVVIEDGYVTVFPSGREEGSFLEEHYLPASTRTPGDQAITLTGNQYFVLGDNRLASSDSRVWGPLERNDIIGRAWIKALPISQFSFFKRPSYSSSSSSF